MPAIVVAALWMAGTLTSFATLAVAARELSATLSTFEILTFRSLIGLAIVLVLAMRHARQGLVTQWPRLQGVRNIIHFAGQYGWFYGVAVLPFAQVFALEFTVPIWTAIIASWFLGEKVGLRRAGAIALGFLGILIILRPGLIPVGLPSLIVLGAAICFATSYSMTKKMTSTDTTLALVFYMNLIQLPLSAVPAAFDWVMPTLEMAPWLLIVGVTGLSAHFCLAKAFAAADAVVVVPMDFFRLPLIAVVGLLFYAEPLEIWVLLGAAVIFSGNLLNLWGERRAE